MDSNAEIVDIEKKVIAEEQKIEKLERKIDTKEKIILTHQEQLLKSGGLKLLGSLNKYQAKLIHSKIIKRLNKHKILYSFITLLAVVLIWYGIQNLLTTIPFIHHPIIAIIIGILIVWLIDKELT